MNKQKLTLALTLPVVGALTSLFLAQPVYAYPACDAQVDLQGQVSKNTAKVTNYSKNPDCTYDATLAVYDSPQSPDTHNWIDAQNLIGSKSVKVKAGETVSLTVEGTGPSCWNQSDLIRGGQAWEKPYYRNAMDADVYQTKSCGETTVTPTASCTPTPTNTPTPTVTGTTTPTTTPESSTATPTPSTTKTVFAGTGNKGLIYMLVLGAIASLTGGLVLKRFNK